MVAETIEAALAHYAIIEAGRSDLPFDIDGDIYKVNPADELPESLFWLDANAGQGHWL